MVTSIKQLGFECLTLTLTITPTLTLTLTLNLTLTLGTGDLDQTARVRVHPAVEDQQDVRHARVQDEPEGARGGRAHRGQAMPLQEEIDGAAARARQPGWGGSAPWPGRLGLRERGRVHGYLLAHTWCARELYWSCEEIS